MRAEYGTDTIAAAYRPYRHGCVDKTLPFGTGRHPAGVDFGDGLAYALAEARRDALLFNGNDFAQTDVASESLSRHPRFGGIDTASPSSYTATHGIEPAER